MHGGGKHRIHHGEANKFASGGDWWLNGLELTDYLSLLLLRYIRTFVSLGHFFRTA